MCGLPLSVPTGCSDAGSYMLPALVTGKVMIGRLLL
jgi:hypothetical protein